MMNADVKAILETLRGLHLDWVADEIEETVRAGRTFEKEYVESAGSKKKRASAVAPYTDIEEEMICLETLKTYFVDLSRMWEKTERSFSELFPSTRDSLIKLTNEEGQLILPFDSQYFQERERLNDLLTKALESLSIRK